MEHKKFRYEDILDHPHHVSQSRPQMPRRDRAAQFASFKALNGYEDAVDEAARTVGAKLMLDEDSRAELDRRIRWLCEEGIGEPISVIYFVHDSKKDGGAYMTVNGTFRRIDEAERLLVLNEGDKIPLESIYIID